MSKSLRFFEIIQILRRATGPVSAGHLAEHLEVSTRTIYRDIASLQAMQTPIYGEAGVGYVLRKGYDLPPLNLDVDEAEAVAIGLALIARTGDVGLWRAAGRAARKLDQVAPGTGQVLASSRGLDAVTTIDLGRLRAAIRNEQKLRLVYRDANAQSSQRVVWPLVLVYFVDAVMIAAWCELRQDLRHFRLDRIQEWALLDAHFTGEGAGLLAKWEATLKDDTVSTRPLRPHENRTP